MDLMNLKEEHVLDTEGAILDDLRGWAAGDCKGENYKGG